MGGGGGARVRVLREEAEAARALVVVGQHALQQPLVRVGGAREPLAERAGDRALVGDKLVRLAHAQDLELVPVHDQVGGLRVVRRRPRAVAVGIDVEGAANPLDKRGRSRRRCVAQAPELGESSGGGVGEVQIVGAVGFVAGSKRAGAG